MPTDKKKAPEQAPAPEESFAGSQKKEQQPTPEVAPEQISSPEAGAESEQGGGAQMQSEAGQHERVSEASAAAVASVSDDQAVPMDQLAEDIEDILEEDLTDMFLAMPADKQVEFQKKGEETTIKIRELVEDTKKNARKIFKLIRDWLRIIPSVNKFFLEQEAKIKTDKIIVKKEQQDQNQNQL